jgi:hypothetical protein
VASGTCDPQHLPDMANHVVDNRAGSSNMKLWKRTTIDLLGLLEIRDSCNRTRDPQLK